MTNATEKLEPMQVAMSADESSATRTSVRRRLLLGVAAVLPSVYTLSSGAQTAVASNLRCWGRSGRDVAHNDFRLTGASLPSDSATQRFTLDNDDWLRKRVYFGKSGGLQAFCVMDEQTLCVDPKNPAQGAQGSVWVVDGNRVIVGQDVSITEVSSAPQAYGLVYVDQQGTIARLDPEVSQQLQPVTGACWTSIMGGRVEHHLG